MAKLMGVVNVTPDSFSDGGLYLDPEAANTLEMTDEQLAQLYPDGPKALPPELR